MYIIPADFIARSTQTSAVVINFDAQEHKPSSSKIVTININYSRVH
jgi:hypothetical protein